MLRRYSLHFALPRVDGALLGEHEADVEQEDTTLSGLLDDLFGLPDGELVLKDHIAQAGHRQVIR